MADDEVGYNVVWDAEVLFFNKKGQIVVMHAR